MDIERPPNLRSPGTEPGSATPPGGAGIGGSPPPINALAELVADLIAATGLVPADKLALVRGAAGMGSFAHALVENNVASSEGLAKTLAARFQMPLVDLALTGVADDASGEIALHVLERLVAIPYAFDNGTLRVAIADPGNIQGIDELRLATRHPLELAVASREDILAEIRRLARASEASGASRRTAGSRSMPRRRDGRRTSASRPCLLSRANRSSCAFSTSRSGRRRWKSSACPTRCVRSWSSSSASRPARCS